MPATRGPRVDKQDIVALWQAFVIAAGEIDLKVVAFASVNDLADEIKRMNVFDLSRFTDHAIAYELRHEALRRLVRSNGNGRE